MKLSLEEIQSALKSAGIDSVQQQKVLSELNKVVDEKKEEKNLEEKPEKVKNEWGVIVFGLEDSVKEADLTAHIYQIPANSDHNTVLSRLSDAARLQNDSARKKKNVLDSIGSLFGGLKRKWSKEKGIMLKSKNIVRVLKSSNKLV